MVDVSLNRPWTHAQPLRDLFICEPKRHELKHFLLALREGRAAHNEDYLRAKRRSASLSFRGKLRGGTYNVDVGERDASGTSASVMRLMTGLATA